MAAGILAEPGSALGPCAEECAHRDCSAVRATATAICRFCSKQIGYGFRFYDDDGRGFVHARCLEEAIEQGRE